jgi:hypothetical protein
MLGTESFSRSRCRFQNRIRPTRQSGARHAINTGLIGTQRIVDRSQTAYLTPVGPNNRPTSDNQGSCPMKQLILAAVAVVSLSIASAQAQSLSHEAAPTNHHTETTGE